MIIDHYGINCADLTASTEFYDAVLGALGHRRVMDFGEAIGYGAQTPDFWLSGFAPGPNREAHIAFTAQTPEQVLAFHEAALGLGAEELHAPRLWPEYHAGYFAVFVRDPDGNNVEAVCHRGAPQTAELPGSST